MGELEAASDRLRVLVLAGPIAPLVCGVSALAAALSVVIAIQSGLAAGFVGLFTNAVALLPSLGAGYVGARIAAVAPPAGQKWWVTRAKGYAFGLFLLALPAFGFVVFAISEGPLPGVPESPAVVVGIAALLVVVYAIPLLIALAVEAWARGAAPSQVSPPAP